MFSDLGETCATSVVFPRYSCPHRRRVPRYITGQPGPGEFQESPPNITGCASHTLGSLIATSSRHRHRTDVIETSPSDYEQPHQNKEEYFFTAFMKLAFSAFNGKEYLPKLCVHRFTDEFYDFDHDSLVEFYNSKYSVGSFSCQNLYMDGVSFTNEFYAVSDESKLPHKPFIFKRLNVSSVEHINYLWLVWI